jgi:gamma-glutamylcyclotransferase (GGCT)/AIG2-like uncharacterized protein YtfP
MHNVIFPKLPALFFVYGTLKNGFQNNTLFREDFDLHRKFRPGVVCLNEWKTVEKYPLLVSGIPFMLDEPGYPRAHQVKGELFEISDISVIYHLDRLEGHPNLYERRERLITNGPDRKMAFIYFLNKNKFPYKLDTLKDSAFRDEYFERPKERQIISPITQEIPHG